MSYLYRYADADEGKVRGIDDEKRSATFVASTERAVSMGWGPPEVLRMSGVDLKRYKANPVVLDSHSRHTVSSILGVAKVEKVGRELHATITFDATPEGEAAWLRVKSGSLRALSVGYSVDSSKVKTLREGETDGTGESLVTGPASVVRGWSLMEISVVPVPADQDALLRRSVYAGQGRKGSASMGLEFSNIEPPAGGTNTPVANPATAPAPQSVAAPVPEERAQRARAALDAQIRALAPASVKDIAEECVMNGLDVETSRALVRTAYLERRGKPIGTPEPEHVPTSNQERSDSPMPPEITDDVFVRSFENLR